MSETIEPPAELVALAKRRAAALNLDPAIVCAMCERESSWDPWMIRYEPDFRSRYVAPLHLPPTVEIARSVSWGLMQVMGQTARELGYVEQFAKLCDPPIGLYWGCRDFARKMREAGNNNVEKALLEYNGGANPAYPYDVLTRAARYRVAPVVNSKLVTG